MAKLRISSVKKKAGDDYSQFEKLEEDFKLGLITLEELQEALCELWQLFRPHSDYGDHMGKLKISSVKKKAGFDGYNDEGTCFFEEPPKELKDAISEMNVAIKKVKKLFEDNQHVFNDLYCGLEELGVPHGLIKEIVGPERGGG